MMNKPEKRGEMIILRLLSNSPYCAQLPGFRWLRRGDRFRSAQRDRRLDQSADVTSVRSAV